VQLPRLSDVHDTRVDDAILGTDAGRLTRLLDLVDKVSIKNKTFVGDLIRAASQLINGNDGVSSKAVLSQISSFAVLSPVP
jgi:hypothetical protein